jgi:thiamine-monophosphate kinase
LLFLLLNSKSLENLTPIHTVGEFELKARLIRAIETHRSSTLLPAGDDASIIQPPVGQNLLITTDQMVEGVHFDLTYFPLKHLGHKLVTHGLSDLAAMNATPTQITVNLALSSKFTLEALDELVAGILYACDDYNVDWVGGDLSPSHSGLVLNITAVGFAHHDQIVTRKGAQKTDLLCITGDLGGAYAGLSILEREKRIFKEAPAVQPQLDGFEYILQKQLRPKARTDFHTILKEWGIQPTTMIDVSDSLASEIHQICKTNNLGARIYEERIPMEQAVIDTLLDLNLDPTTIALNGGEDYELLFSVPLEQYDTIKNNPHITILGHLTEAEAGVILETKNGNEHPIHALGWETPENS